MTLFGSTFLFEVFIKDVKSYKDCKDNSIVGRFDNIFQFNLNNPNNENIKDTRAKQKTKLRINKSVRKKSLSKTKVHLSESILIDSSPYSLLGKMKKYPLELFICKISDPDLIIASTCIPWNNLFIHYLYKLKKKPDMLPPVVDRLYNLYDKNVTKRIAIVEMSMKLTYLRDKFTNQSPSLCEDKQNTFLYTQNISKPISVLRNFRKPIRDNQSKNLESKKSIYAKRSEQYHSYDITKINDSKMKHTHKKDDEIYGITKTEELKTNINIIKKMNSSVKMVETQPQIVGQKQKSLLKSKSYSSIFCSEEKNVFQYIFGCPKSQFNEKIYHVGYCTIKNDDSDPYSGKSSSYLRSTSQSALSGSINNKKSQLKKCDGMVQARLKKPSPGLCSKCALLADLSGEDVIITKCKRVDCDYKKYRELPLPPDERILLDLNKSPCQAGIGIENKIEEIMGGVSAELKLGKDPCFCTCECTFGFIKKTTFCKVCGGYETLGEDLSRKTAQEMPIPCPIFHKLSDKNKLKTYSTSGSESKKRGDDQKSIKLGSEKGQIIDKRDVESQKDSKKGKKKRDDDRFKFNYGYKGIPPQIGHSKCALPCAGTLSNVPRKMGWLWTADTPGMKFRPMWKPGAVNKHVARMLKIARNPGGMSKKKRKDTSKKKRPLKRPLLVVHKKQGEYTVTMETMKSYNKPRALNQHPYEDKPLVTYTIGRTEEENRERLKKKEREQRRLERAQREFIQSAFRDMCQEICLKTYQQALGILPGSEVTCPCYPALPSPKSTNMSVSCSCCEDSASIGSETDSDEWIIEFTPPNAIFDPSYKGKKVIKSDNSTQYTYLDYRVTLLDKCGNPVPRFFKGPDGKKQCSDLGGFWSPDRKWLEINIDGFVGPDGRWAPHTFIGPNGEQVDAETGKFQTIKGNWLVVGVHGYVNPQGKWRNYQKPYKAFADVSPKPLSKLGIVGHGGDRKLLNSTPKEMLLCGEDLRLTQPTTVSKSPPLNNLKKRQQQRLNTRCLKSFNEETKCRHPIPSGKGVAVNDRGHKTYFRLKDRKNKQSKYRLDTLVHQGISLSSFHIPCFHSIINLENMKQQHR